MARTWSKTGMIQVRIAALDKRRYMAAARRARMSLSAWIRSVLDRALDKDDQ